MSVSRHRRGDGPPVFVVGCPRSGTTLLYHMLVSSGEFANYRAETHLYDMMLPFFGPFSRRRNRERFLDRYLRSYYFERTGLDAERVRNSVLTQCDSGGAFLEIVLGGMAEEQGTPRWAECTPAHLLYMHQIKSEVPDARFLHIVRDGRDVAVSLNKVGWAHPLPWDRGISIQASGWMWQWMVDGGCRAGETLGPDYRKVRFEDLVRNPGSTLRDLSKFVGCPLDYEMIRENAVGSVGVPNTAFPENGTEGFNPVGRFRKRLTDRDLAQLEGVVGDTLRRHGYELLTDRTSMTPLKARSRVFQLYRSFKLLTKSRTPLGRVLSSPDLPA